MAYSKSSSASDALLIRPVLMGAFVTTSSKNPNKKKRQIEFGKQNKNRRSWIIEWVVIGDADKWDKLMKLMNWVKTGSHGPQRYANELVSQVCQHLFLLLLGTAPRRREHRCLLSLSLSLSLSRWFPAVNQPIPTPSSMKISSSENPRQCSTIPHRPYQAWNMWATRRWIFKIHSTHSVYSVTFSDDRLHSTITQFGRYTEVYSAVIRISDEMNKLDSRATHELD